jgi:hypothetical protein
MIRLASEHLYGDHGLLELVAVAFQMPLGQEPEESAHPLIPKEPRAR